MDHMVVLPPAGERCDSAGRWTLDVRCFMLAVEAEVLWYEGAVQ